MAVQECATCRGTGTNQGNGHECGYCKGWGHLLVSVVGPCDPRGNLQEKALSDTVQPPLKERLARIERRTVLSQDEVWYPKDGDPVRLQDMDTRYLTNVRNFLYRKAAALKNQEEWDMLSFAGTLGGEMAQDAMDSMLFEIMDMDPAIWLSQQLLMIRIEELIKAGDIDNDFKPIGL
jgi:hypothetical protein